MDYSKLLENVWNICNKNSRFLNAYYFVLNEATKKFDAFDMVLLT